MKSLDYQKLSEVENREGFSEKTVSPKRRIEFFYDNLFNALYGNPETLTEEKSKEVKNKMHLFCLAYGVSRRLAPKSFGKNQKELKTYIEGLNDENDFDENRCNEKLKNVLTILLKDVVTNLRGQGQEYILTNIFGKCVQELGATNIFCPLGEVTMYQTKKFKGKVSDTLGGEDYLQSNDKSQFLIDQGLSYKRGIETYYLKIREKCFSDEDKKDPNKVAETMEIFNVAYNICKLKFNTTTRESGERYFEHLLSVIDLYLNYEENPTFEGVMIALLHDIVEDSDIDYDTLKLLFGDVIATGVSHLSKPSVEGYLETDDEKEFFRAGIESGFLNSTGHLSDDIIRKERNGTLNEKDNQEYTKFELYINIKKKYKKIRNEIFFEEFLKKSSDPNISQHDEEVTRIKMYDRLHNITTLAGMGIERVDKIFGKIDETIKYFLPITGKKYPDLHEILIKELETVLKTLWGWMGIDNLSEVFKNASDENEFIKNRGININYIRDYKKTLRGLKLIKEQVNLTLEAA